MCTLTYLPLKNNGFILTFSREEKTTRKTADPPQTKKVRDIEVCYPIDGHAGGTWIASAKNSSTTAIFNGALEKSVPDSAEKRSRGLIIPDFYTFHDLQSFLDDYDFSRYNPFTLLIISNDNHLAIKEILWDGNQISIIERNAEVPAIWSSVNIYNKEEKEKIKNKFNQWLNKEPLYDMHTVLGFHKNNLKQIQTLHHDKGIKTLSITSIKKTSFLNKMRYEDVINNRIYMKTIA